MNTSRDKTELKPCPFCGSSSKVWFLKDNIYEVICNDVECNCSLGYSDTEELAIENWNRRYEPSKPSETPMSKEEPMKSLKDENARLKSELESFNLMASNFENLHTELQKAYKNECDRVDRLEKLYIANENNIEKARKTLDELLIKYGKN